MLLLLAAVEIVRLTPEAAAAAQAEGEARALAQYVREDAARVRRAPRGFLGGGIGTRPLAQGHAPLGDVGGSDFVYGPSSLGRTRYRDN